MRVRLKRVEDQVIVITGGTSGIGLATARRAAARGARVVVTSRDQEDLEDAVVEIERHGGRALPVVADVTVPSQVEEVARLAIHTYGRIDTWVNNAGVSFFGRLMEAPIEDMRRVFEVNFWGTVYGSRAAVPHLRRQGGALINIGRLAVKGFTDALRVELREEGAPVSVTLIKPSSVAMPGPGYDPEMAAEAILAATERPVRELAIGPASRLLAFAAAGIGLAAFAGVRALKRAG
jgi:NAD(P)-dependent dehydrogenase (short-subunit alcohol dehydrogenase family)